MYASATLSLAALEYFVHLNSPEAPDDLVALGADIPDNVSRMEVDGRRRPADGRAYPAPESLADLGSSWIREGKTAVLIVPSAVIPSERNYLLNPVHPHFGTIRIGRPTPFSFDLRLWKPEPPSPR